MRTFSQPDTIHAICEDYRAAASIDLVHDKEDLDKKVQGPLLLLWSEKGPFHRMYDVLQTWRDRADHAQGKAMPTGHFLGADAAGVDARNRYVLACLTSPGLPLRAPQPRSWRCREPPRSVGPDGSGRS